MDMGPVESGNFLNANMGKQHHGSEFSYDTDANKNDGSNGLFKTTTYPAGREPHAQLIVLFGQKFFK
jgi:hypothetical protein